MRNKFFFIVLFAASLVAISRLRAEEALMVGAMDIQMVDADIETVKAAQIWFENINPELSSQLAEIVSGNKAGASATLSQAATEIAEADSDLAAKLQNLASKWA
jgi:hypothetical protein